ncbi:damage-inducible protein, partial [SAR202 cluster bacterium AD-802-L14_MRT_200m]|nr:damage-inducible protein [SAR202 cluster bacterium AD-802-L14_MRT_200m]
SRGLQQTLAEGSELKLDDATKIVGCYKALAKIGLDEGKQGEIDNPPNPMKRALAFSQTINLSKMLAAEFNNVVNEYETSEDINFENKAHLEVEVAHVDGTFNAEQRNEKLNWLKDDIDDDQCRVLTNVRCLSEGVDVPALDAIMFLHPRKSQIDVVQAVGRVMRKAEGKDLGYVILPITVAPGVDPATALNNNEKYQVVWQILNALRAHDERFDSTINRIGLGEDVSDRLEIVGVGAQEELEATTAVVEDVKTTPNTTKEEDEVELIDDGSSTSEPETLEEEQLSFVLTDLTQAIKAKIVEKCGTRDYWENWATDIAKIAQTHITRINSIVLNSGTPERESFLAFLNELRDDLNPEITESDAVEMLAQHIITKPVFDSLFHGNQFTSENAISRAMESVLGNLYQQNLEVESESLGRFYQSVERRSADVVTLKGRQQLILELYDRFFSNAFPLTTRKLGIVYTPVEVVDFIIHSVNDVLKEEFNTSVGDKNVHILDPFTGTGTFITRLLHSGLISKQDLAHKYKNEIHANEIVLLAYYIAAINIEAAYQDLVQEDVYQPFDGIVLTDTFQLYEEERDMVANLLPDNANRRTTQKERDITVIVGNPPYSTGQSSANDNAANITYVNLDESIRTTYAHFSKTTNKRALYDSYIRAFRWASDRVGDEGVIGFVSNAGWIDGNATDGMRKCLTDEFSKIYVFHLRGNQRTSGETSRKEGGKIFGSGSRTPIAITILVKDPNAQEKGKIFFHDIGDYLDREQKLAIVQEYKSINQIKSMKEFRVIEPDENNDWVNQGDRSYGNFMSIGNKKDKKFSQIFHLYSAGIMTQRDAWAINSSKSNLLQNISKSLEFYESERTRFSAKKNLDSSLVAKSYVDRDHRKFSWCDKTFNQIEKNRLIQFDPTQCVIVHYRPFEKRWLYNDRVLNWSQYQQNHIFLGKKSENLVISMVGAGSGKDFSCLMSDSVPERQTLGNGQSFPLKRYGTSDSTIKLTADQPQLFANQSNPNNGVKDGITDEGLQHFLDAYSGWKFTKEDLFYYVYGLLHSTEYRERFQNNLSKELPRIPAVKRFEDFMAFSKAGRKLGDLHVNYENVEPYPVTMQNELLAPADPKSLYRVEKMKFAGKRGNLDKTTVIYNNNYTMRDIPLEAYEYVVNGKPALEWVMERQVVKTDKASGIVNDANDYANETMNNPKYPLELFQRVITVSLKTMKIVRSLPKLDID